MMLLARAATMPCRAMSSTLAPATRAGDGVRRFSSGKRRHDRLAERLDESAGDGGGRLHGHLLPEDRAQSHLESVEGAGHAQAGIRLDGAGQSRVPGQMLRDHVRPRVEIEQRPHAAEQRRQHRRQAVGELEQQRVLAASSGSPGSSPSPLPELHGPRVELVGHVLDARRARAPPETRARPFQS